jgi:adenylosuccinate lyase
MEAVRAGADRQDAHERLRVLSRRASEAMHAGEPNPLRAFLERDSLFGPLAPRLDALLDPARFVGRAPEQVAEFVEGEVAPALARWSALPRAGDELRV